jgi:hypothetical protein
LVSATASRAASGHLGGLKSRRISGQPPMEPAALAVLLSPLDGHLENSRQRAPLRGSEGGTLAVQRSAMPMQTAIASSALRLASSTKPTRRRGCLALLLPDSTAGRRPRRSHGGLLLSPGRRSRLVVSASGVKQPRSARRATSSPPNPLLCWDPHLRLQHKRPESRGLQGTGGPIGRPPSAAGACCAPGETQGGGRSE